MSTDLKLERFGLELFNALFSHYEGLPLPVGKTYRKALSVMNGHVIEAVVLHSKFFQYHHEGVYVAACGHPLINVMDFFHIISKNFPHRHLQNTRDEVMRKFVLSCAYFVNMIVTNDLLLKVTKGVNMFQKAHLMWAMFADSELKDEFYANGGWLELQRFTWKNRIVIDIGVKYVYPEEEDGNSWMDMLELIWRTVGFLNTATTEPPLSLQWSDFVVETPRGTCAGNEFPRGWTIVEIEELLSVIRRLSDPYEREDEYFTLVVMLAEKRGVRLETAVKALFNYRLAELPEEFVEDFKNCFTCYKEDARLKREEPSPSSVI